MNAMKSRLLRSSAAVATAAILAFWFTFGGAQIVRAADPETLAPSGQNMVLISEKSVQALEQRIITLEETVAALTESWQHINTHRLCVSDDSGAESCITKAQLDSFLSKEAHAEISQPAVSEEVNASPPAAPTDIAAAKEPTPSSEPTITVGENVPAEPEYTQMVNPTSSGVAVSGAAVVSYPEVETYGEPAGRSND